MTLSAAHGALFTVLDGATFTAVQAVYNYEDPNLYGQGRTVATVSFDSPVMTADSWGLVVRVYASWANGFDKAHASLLVAVQEVDDALTDTYPRASWDTGANVEVGCFVATAKYSVGREDF